MSLTALLAAAILSIAPVGQTRALEIATAQAQAVDLARELPFDGPAAREASGLLLVVTDAKESSFRLDLETCVETHDHGRGFTSYGLHMHHMGAFAPAQVCQSPRLAARLALGALVGARLRGGWTTRGTFAGYLGRAQDDREVSARRDLLVKLGRSAGIEITDTAPSRAEWRTPETS